MGNQLLLVDPDPAAVNLVTELRIGGYDVDLVADGGTALARTNGRGYDAVLTELDIRPMDGFELCRRLRTHTTAPILVLSTRAGEIDRVVAFEVGADDYILKPYFAREVVLRVRARLRSVAAPTVAPTLRVGELELDTERRHVTRDGVRLHLTPTEFTLLTAIARRQGAVATRDDLLREVWGLSGEDGSRTLDTHVRRLREKLGSAADRIETLRGVGYRCSLPQRPEAPRA